MFSGHSRREDEQPPDGEARWKIRRREKHHLRRLEQLLREITSPPHFSTFLCFGAFKRMIEFPILNLQLKSKFIVYCERRRFYCLFQSFVGEEVEVFKGVEFRPQFCTMSSKKIQLGRTVYFQRTFYCLYDGLLMS